MLCWLVSPFGRSRQNKWAHLKYCSPLLTGSELGKSPEIFYVFHPFVQNLVKWKNSQMKRWLEREHDHGVQLMESNRGPARQVPPYSAAWSTFLSSKPCLDHTQGRTRLKVSKASRWKISLGSEIPSGPKYNTMRKLVQSWEKSVRVIQTVLFRSILLFHGSTINECHAFLYTPERNRRRKKV